jgi:predicted aldo/keto reductase-like oxidoreductase
VLAHDVSTVILGLRSKEEVDWAVQVADGFDELTPDEKQAYKFEAPA